MTPRLSIIIPAYNPGAFLLQTLASVERQTLAQLEAIVVDDGSTDGSIDTARRWIASRDRAHADIRIVSQQQAGVSAARNRGIAEARSDLVGFLDADDLWMPDKALRHVSLMEERKPVVLSFSSYANIDQGGTQIGDPFKVQPGVRKLPDLLARNVIHTSTVVARKDALETAGGFDSDLDTYEDLDLWLRLSNLVDAEVYAFSDVDTLYRRHAGQTTRDWEAMRGGWERMAENAARRYPDAWRQAAATASAYQHEYGAWLAHASGDYAAMRRLTLAAWKSSPSAMLKSEFSFMATAIAAASLLPRPAQIALGRTYVACADVVRRLRNPAHADLSAGLHERVSKSEGRE